MEDRFDQSVWEAFKTALTRIWKVIFIPVVILFPIIFAVTLMIIAPIASNLGLFYMRPELPTLLTVLLVPLSWVLLGLRKRTQTAKRFAGRTAVILLICLSVSTAMETASLAKLVKIDKTVTASLNSEGWVKQPRDSSEYFNPGIGLVPICFSLAWINQPSCPELDSSWEKVQDTPLTFNDVKKIAEEKGLRDYKVDDFCSNIDTESPHSCKLTGKIDGQRAELAYRGSNGYGSTKSDHWTLHLSLRLK